MCSLDEVMAVLRSALFDEPYHAVKENINDILTELENQTVLPLVFPILPQLGLTPDRYEYWENQIYSYIVTNQSVMDAEKKAIGLLHQNHIPCVILKGSSYAQYYPHPELRVRGDIDILVQKKDFEAAADLLVANSYSSKTTPQKSPEERHIEYFKNGIEIELHQYYSDDDKNSEYFSVTKAQSVENFIPCFPSVENGISILLHMKFHFGKIGIRHYIDWIMYVQRVCNDTFWNTQFCGIAEKFHMIELAKALTKCGKLYFPLPYVTWCDDIDSSLSKNLLEEFFQAGNFNVNIAKKKALKITSSNKNVFFWAKRIARHGVKNWPPSQKHKVLIPVAFLKQLYTYTKWYIRENGINIKELKKESKNLKSEKEGLNLQK